MILNGLPGPARVEDPWWSFFCYTVRMKIRVGQASIGIQLIAIYAFTFAAVAALVLTQPHTVPVSIPSIIASAPSAVATAPAADALTNPAVFLALFAVMSIVVFTMVRRISSNRFWHIFFGVGAFVGLYTVGVMLMSRLIPTTAAMVTSAVITVGVLAWRQKTKQMIAHHCVIIIAIVGVSVILAEQFTTRAAMLIVAVLAMYDIIAVYFTKHMIELAQTFFKREAWFGIIIPSTLALWKSPTTAVHAGRDALILGAGDIVIPLLFATTHLYENGLAAFLIMSTSTLVGVAALFYWYIHLRRGQSIPALPPIAVALFIGHWIVINL